jgi:hypothetical protein
MWEAESRAKRDDAAVVPPHAETVEEAPKSSDPPPLDVSDHQEIHSEVITPTTVSQTTNITLDGASSQSEMVDTSLSHERTVSEVEGNQHSTDMMNSSTAVDVRSGSSTSTEIEHTKDSSASTIAQNVTEAHGESQSIESSSTATTVDSPGPTRDSMVQPSATAVFSVSHIASNNLPSSTQEISSSKITDSSPSSEPQIPSQSSLENTQVISTTANMASLNHSTRITTPSPSRSVSNISLSIPQPAPTGGESIYRTIMNRLSALETNHTLYARYVEEQTASVREMLRRLGEDVGRLEGIVSA